MKEKEFILMFVLFQFIDFRFIIYSNSIWAGGKKTF